MYVVVGSSTSASSVSMRRFNSWAYRVGEPNPRASTAFKYAPRDDHNHDSIDNIEAARNGWRSNML